MNLSDVVELHLTITGRQFQAKNSVAIMLLGWVPLLYFRYASYAANGGRIMCIQSFKSAKKLTK
jgi:hypothetical protein